MTSFTITLLSALMALGAPEIHLAPFDAPMPPNENSGIHRIALSAAANEQEAFYVRVVNDQTPRTLESLSIDWNTHLEAVTTVYRVEATPDNPAAGREALWPLVDPVAVAPGAALDLLVSLKVTAASPPGAFSGNLIVKFDSGKAERIPVTLEVFDFVLPDESSLPVLFGLDRPAITKEAGLSEKLDDWALLYDALAGLRAGYAVWPQREYPDHIFYDYRDLNLVKEHLAYAVRTANLPAVEIGGRPGALLADWPPAVGNSPQDPLQLLMHNLTESLQGLNWSKPTVLIPGSIPTRDGWPGMRQELARVGRVDNLISRLLPGPLNPYFERYTDIWALPGATPSTAMSLLQRSLSTIRYAQPEFSTIGGTPGGLDESETYATSPGDAVDGCEYTTWRVDPEVGPATLELSFDPPLYLNQVTVIWPHDGTRVNMAVQTAYNPGSYADATVRWTESNIQSEGENDISLGEFKHPRACAALRITFEPDKGNGAAVAEVLFNQDGRTVVNSSIDTVTPWLNLRTGKSPWLAPKTPGMAWRILPWFCWQRNFQGILGPELTPEPENRLTRLIAAGPAGVYPSVSMLHLLDGLEDYEYLVRYWKAVADKEVAAPDTLRPGAQALPTTVTEIAEVQRALHDLGDVRIRVGRLLSGHPMVTRNFGPRGE